MKILYVSHYFVPFSVGGTEEYTRALAKEMQALGHSVHVFHGVIDKGFEDHHTFRHEVEGIPCTCVSVDLKTIDDFSGTWKQKEVEAILARLLDEQEFDVAHVQHLTRLSTGIARVLREKGIPTVLTLHDYWMQCARGQRVQADGTICHEVVETACAECMAPLIDGLDSKKSGWRRALSKARGPGGRLARIVERRREMQSVLESVDLVLTPSGFTAEAFRKWGVRREIAVETTGVDPSMAKGYAETSSPRVRFGFLGRLMPTKGLEVLLDAFRKADVDAELVVHGFGDGGAYDASLRARGADPRIRFTGAFEQSEVASLYSTFDVQVVPSTWLECSPLVIHTARLFRKPIVASAIGGLIEMVRDGVDGLLFRVGDADDLAAKFRTLAGDPATVRRLRDALPTPRTYVDHALAIARRYEGLRRNAGAPRTRKAAP